MIALLSFPVWGAPPPAAALACQPAFAALAPQIGIYDPEAALSRSEIADLSQRMKASTPDGKRAAEQLIRKLQPLIRKKAATVANKMAYAHSPVNFRDPNIREDLESAVLLKLIGAPPFDPSRSSVEAWIYIITKNAAIDMQRRASRHTTVSLDREIEGTDSFTLKDSLPGREAEPADTLALAETQARVRKALSILPQELRQLGEMVYIEQMTYQAIANRLQIPVGTVKSRIFRLKSELKMALETTPQ